MGDPKTGATPPTWKLALVKWVGIYPPLLVLAYGFDFLSKQFLPTSLWIVKDDGTMLLWFKLLCETAILVPFLNFILTPWLDDVFARFLYSHVDDE